MDQRILVATLLRVFLGFAIFIVCSGKIKPCSIETYPSAVAIVNIQNRLQSCSGAIVSRNIVASTRLCKAINNRLDELAVVTNSSSLNQIQFHAENVKKIKRVECPKDEKDEVCLFEITGEFDGKNIASFEESRPQKGQKLQLVGWRIATLDRMAKRMLMQEITVNEKCSGKASQSIFCADPGFEQPGNCPGDIGSPIYKDQKLLGIFISGYCRGIGKEIRASDVLHIRKELRHFSRKGKRSHSEKILDSKLITIASIFASLLMAQDIYLQWK